MWTYRQTTGALSHNGVEVSVGYSGAGLGKNSPTFQNVHNVGPIPQGRYAIGEPYNTSTHGPYVLRLTPDAANEMFGRSGFLIHGESLKAAGSASLGCIILPRLIRERIWTSLDHLLEVKA